MQYAARLKAVFSNGSIFYSDSMITIQNADEVTFLLTASTNYKLEYWSDPIIKSLGQLNKIASKSYAALLKNHVKFGKVSLNLSNNGRDTIPTDVRLKNQLKNPGEMFLKCQKH